MKELTPRDWAVYNYLKEQKDWVTQRDIAYALPEYFPSFDEFLQDFHNTNTRHYITNSIRALNNSDVIQKIILSGAKGIKIATQEEFEEHIGKEIMAAVRKLERAKKKAEKGNADGQYKWAFGKYERPIIQAFTDSNKVGEHTKGLRLQHGLTQMQLVNLLCKYTQVDVSWLSRVENGIFYPTNEQLTAIEKVFNELGNEPNSDLQAVRTTSKGE